MRMMKAVTISGAERDHLELTEVSLPEHGSDDLLVQIKAVGVGIHDSYFLPAGITTPYTIGIEAAGVVEEVGSNLTGRYRPGDRIAFISTNQLKGGTWAEYAAVRGDSLILPIPHGLTFEKAAAAPVAINAALRALHALPPIPEGGSIFIAGASGAIGTFAIQLARAKGWDVAGSASPGNHDYLASLGAAKTVDYHDPDWPEQIRQWRPGGVDAALAIQPATTATSVDVVKDGGTVVTVSGEQVHPTRPVTVTGLAYAADVHAGLLTFMNQLAAGQMHLEIEKTYPFDEALTALAKVGTRHARGKIVLSLP